MLDYARSLNFKGSRSRFTPRAKSLQYYFDSNADFYRDGVAEFAVRTDMATNGRVVRRLEANTRDFRCLPVHAVL